MQATGKQVTPPIERWLEIGNKNPWICEAYDPPFTEKSFRRYTTIYDAKDIWVHLGQDSYFYDYAARWPFQTLAHFFVYNNWSLGTAAYYQDPQTGHWLCFINQIEGGGEWLTIRNNLAFESVSFHIIIEKYGPEKVAEYIRWFCDATEEQLRRLDYVPEGAKD